MDYRSISVIALPMADEPNLETKFKHALELLEFAVRQGAELVCFPENANRFRGNTPALPLRRSARMRARRRTRLVRNAG
jgi:predicted amidohydrolase